MWGEHCLPAPGEDQHLTWTPEAYDDKGNGSMMLLMVIAAWMIYHVSGTTIAALFR